MRSIYERAGYKLELRHNGEHVLGLWRRQIKPSIKSAENVESIQRLVLIPGFGDSPLSWAPVLLMLRAALRQKYNEVIVVEMPGNAGVLSDHHAFHSMDFLVNSVFEMLDTLKPHTIIGHSLGGWLAASYACSCGNGTHPKVMDSDYKNPKEIILACPSGLTVDDQDRKAWSSLFLDIEKSGFDEYSRYLFNKPPVWLKLIKKEFTSFFSKREVLDFINSIKQHHFVKNDIHKINTKVTLIWGSDDRLNYTHWVYEWLKLLNLRNQDKAEAYLLNNTGHCMHIERPVVTAAAIARIILGKDWMPFMKNQLLPMKNKMPFWEIISK